MKLYSQRGDGKQISFELAGIVRNYNFSSLHDTIEPLAILYNSTDGQEPIAWWMFALAGLAAVVIALVTVSSQAVRGALLNPTKSLKTE